MTRQPSLPTLNKSGNIFMAEGNQDQGRIPHHRESTIVTQPTSQEKVNAARTAWERYNQQTGFGSSLEERRSQELMIERGLGPNAMSGGAEKIFRGDYEAEPALLGIVEDVNRRIVESGGDAPDSAYLEGQIMEIEDMLDSNRDLPVEDRINVARAQELARQLESLRQEAVIREEGEDEERQNQRQQRGRQNPIRTERDREGAEARERLEALVGAMYGEDYEEIKRVIDLFDLDDGHYAQVVKAAIETVRGKDHIIEYVLEYGVERIINTADDRPEDEYPQFDMYQQQNLNKLQQFGRQYDERRRREGINTKGSEMFKYLSNLVTKRRAMHMLFQNMNDKKAYQALVTQHLRKDGLAFVEKHIVGVSDVQIMYEQILASKLSSSKNWLTVADFKSADEEVEAMLGNAASHEDLMYKEFTRADGTKGRRKLQDWEIKRAQLVGRSLSAASERRLVYGVLGDVPEDVDTLLKSVESEFLARAIAPLKLIPARFFEWPIARRFLEVYLEKLKTKDGKIDNHKYGYVRNNEAAGLYGQSQDALAILDTGISDPKSNGWRSREMLLKQDAYKIEAFDGEKVAIGDYLDKVGHHTEHEVVERLRRENPGITKNEIDHLLKSERHPYKKEIKAKFNAAVKDVIARQRLFLGLVVRNGELDDDNKRVIWENVAKLIPSRIAAFFPTETLEIMKNRYGIGDKEAKQRWDALKMKLFLAERYRVKNDSDYSKAMSKGEATDLQYRGIETFFTKAGITDDEAVVIREVQALGRERADDLRQIKFAFTAFLDDVPETSWEKLSNEDFKRILVSDQDSFEEAYNGISGLMSNPAIGSGEVINVFKEAFHKMASPLGNPDAQKQLRPFINTYLSMARLNEMGKWLNSAMKATRKPRSEFEKYNLQANIANDESQTAKLLEGLAAVEVIPDDPTEADENGQTQLQIMKKENDADRKARLLMLIRILIQLLGPTLAVEILRGIMGKAIVEGLTAAA